MSSQRIKTLITSIKQKQLKSSFTNTAHKTPSSITTTIQQSLKKQKQIQLSYDQLLLDSLSLIQLIQDTIKIKSEQYTNLIQELEIQKISRKQDNRQYQDNINITSNKIEQLQSIILTRQQQNMHLRNYIEQKQLNIQQLQFQNNNTINKIQQIYTARFQQQYSTLITKYNQQIYVLQQKIKVFENSNKELSEQNCLLTSRLDQVIKYVRELEQSKDGQCYRQGSGSKQIQYQLSPRILYNYRSQSNSSPERQQNLSNHWKQSAQRQKRHRLKDNIDQIDSCQAKSAQRMVLHQILNTQDRKSKNFGNNYYSKQKQHFLYSNEENNFNTLNKIEYQQHTIQKQKNSQTGTFKLNIIKQFKSDHIQLLQLPQSNKQLDKKYMENARDIDPYYIFFTLISQCAKINSNNLQAAACLNLDQYWDELLNQRIPLHQWHTILVQKINVKLQKYENKSLTFTNQL